MAWSYVTNEPSLFSFSFLNTLTVGLPPSTNWLNVIPLFCASPFTIRLVAEKITW